MGIFSRKQKSPRESGILESQSTTSFGSSTFRGLANNRVSAGSMLTPNTPLSPLPSLKIPKLDLPRPPDPALDPAGYLRSLGAIRDRAKVLLEKAEDNELVHFDVDMNKFPNVVTFVSGLIKVRLFICWEIESLWRRICYLVLSSWARIISLALRSPLLAQDSGLFKMACPLLRLPLSAPSYWVTLAIISLSV